MKKIPKGTAHNGNILVIDDEPEICWIFSKILTEAGYDVSCAQSGKEGLDKVQKLVPDLVFLDLKLPDTSGIDVLEDIKTVNPHTMVIMMTGYETIESAVKAMKIGAYDYIPKPIPEGRLKIIADNALKTQKISRELGLLRNGYAVVDEIIGQSDPMQRLVKLVRTVASHDLNVILRGETGTGKDLVAHSIHSLSKRREAPFVAVDCAILPETLVESELFGYEKGAFTGADVQKKGKFELANNGTVFLDEIGNIPLHLQVKLLRVLQEKKIERLGGKNPITMDFRVISATNIDLETAVRNGQFREDLYHRINVFEIVLPPLRERGDDVVLLSHYFLHKFSKEMGKNINHISDEVLKIFKSHRWPGNVRELENTIKRSIILAKDKILPSDLPGHIISDTFLQTDKDDSVIRMNIAPYKEKTLKGTRKDIVDGAEKYLIIKTLNETNWNKKKASEILEIDYKTLFNKIKKYNLTRHGVE